jgi:hypothetical protein
MIRAFLAATFPLAFSAPVSASEVFNLQCNLIGIHAGAIFVLLTGAASAQMQMPGRHTDPPDHAHVFSLPSFLQGTLVTMAFNIKPDLLGTKNENHD